MADDPTPKDPSGGSFGRVRLSNSASWTELPLKSSLCPDKKAVGLAWLLSTGVVGGLLPVLHSGQVGPGHISGFAGSGACSGHDLLCSLDWDQLGPILSIVMLSRNLKREDKSVPRLFFPKRLVDLLFANTALYLQCY